MLSISKNIYKMIIILHLDRATCKSPSKARVVNRERSAPVLPFSILTFTVMFHYHSLSSIEPRAALKSGGISNVTYSAQTKDVDRPTGSATQPWRFATECVFMCSPLTGWRGGEGVTLPLAQCVIERPWPVTGKYKVNRAMIFRLFNFCIHLPPSLVPPNKFTSPSWVCLRSPQAISGVRDLSETFPSAARRLHVHPPSLCAASLLLQPGDRVGAVLRGGMRRQRSELSCWRRTGRRERRQDRGIFPSEWGHGRWPLSQQELSFKTHPWPPSTRSPKASSYHDLPQNRSKPLIKTL